MPRTLAMQERRVTEAERAEYLAALSARSSSASAAQAHFWAFEHASDRGRFVEFVEAADREALTRFLGVDDPPEYWLEVRRG